MRPIKLTRVDNGRTIDVASESLIEISLPENPTTGYRWTVYELQNNLLNIKGTRFVAGDSGVGAGGTRVFEFQTVGSGVATLRFKLFREWEGDGSIIERFEVTTRIK